MSHSKCYLYDKHVFSDLGLDVEFVQDNHSLSHAVGTLRGLYFQSPPAAQGKLVRCGRGAIFDVAARPMGNGKGTS